LEEEFNLSGFCFFALPFLHGRLFRQFLLEWLNGCF
jgi:hypothetical protein